MSHPTGSELQGEDENDEEVFYGGAGGSGLSNHEYDDDDDYDDDYAMNNNNNNDEYHQNPNSYRPGQEEADNWLPSNSEHNDSFYDDSYGAVADDADDGFGSVAHTNASNNNNNHNNGNSHQNLNKSSATRASVTTNPNDSSMKEGGNNNSNSTKGGGATLPGGQQTGSSSRFSNGSSMKTMNNNTNVAIIKNANNAIIDDDDEDVDSFCCFKNCDMWEHRGFLSLCGIFALYIIFGVTEQCLKTMTQQDHKIIQWGSFAVSLCIGGLCIFQALNTYHSFKNTSQDLAFLFVSIFGILAFFLVLRALMVFPPIQSQIGKYLTIALIPNCDAISMAFLLLRVPKSK